MINSTDSLSTLWKRSPLLIFSFELSEQKFKFLNPAFREFFGTSENMLNPGILLSMVHDDDRLLVEDKLKECITRHSVNGVEFRIVSNGKEHSLRIDAYLLEENGNTLLVGHAEDITVHMEYINNLNRHNSKKNAILNILAHDLSGPIGAITNLSELLHRETLNLKNEKIEKYLTMIDKISKRAISLIRNFINQEFLESEAVNVLKRRVELLSRITNATDEYLQLYEHLNLNFLCSANKEAIYLDIDEDKFLQVINNLISNSMKFTPDGGKITIYIEERDHSVLIKIADTGIGIPAKFHDTLFDKFTNARRKGLKGEDSNGLGMSIIKTIVEWHQGKIWFESEEQKGTTFFIELPK